MTYDAVGMWIAGILTLATWSYLFGNNVVFQTVEHIFIGISAAHMITVALGSIKTSCLIPLANGAVIYAVPLIGGILLYTRFIRNSSWLARIPVSFMMGTAAGVSLKGLVDASFIKQVKATILPLTSLDNIIIVMGTVSALWYFLFTQYPNRGPLIAVSRLGRYFMMISLGAAYGNTVMFRMSLLIQRIYFLLGDMLKLVERG